MAVRSLALSAALCTLLASRAVAQSATRDRALAEAVRVEPKGDPCLTEAIVRGRVAKRLARDAELSNVEIVVHATDPPRLTVFRAGQLVAERRFEDFPVRCNARRDAIAVAVALALERGPEPPSDPTSTTSTAPSATAPASSATPSAAASSTVSAAGATAQNAAAAASADDGAKPESRQERPESGSGIELGAHAGASAVLEVLPGLAFAGVLGADVGLPPARLRVSLSVLASLPQEDEALGATVESQLLLGRLLGCADISANELALEGCGGVLAGAAFAEGSGYASTRSTELAYAALVARLALRYPAEGRISARLALDGLLPLVRPSYAVREQPRAGLAKVTPAPIGASLGLEVVLALP